jgi:hypothetical protein
VEAAEMKKAGDCVALGDIVGHPQESNLRHARVVGLRKDACPAIEGIILRKFTSPDEPYPTGGYYTAWFVVPWEKS